LAENIAIGDKVKHFNPYLDLNELFIRVQIEGIFSDSKTFADAVPLFDTDQILINYNNKKDLISFDLKGFIFENFTIQNDDAGVSNHIQKYSSAKEHVEKLWGFLVRKSEKNSGSLIHLPKPYVVPGGRFREIYYWDGYFTMLGLKCSEKHEIIRDMVENYAYLIDEFGFIPNGNRSYYLTRSQPPFFAKMVALLDSISKSNGNISQSDFESCHFSLKYIVQIEKEYEFWMNDSNGSNNLSSLNGSSSSTGSNSTQDSNDFEIQEAGYKAHRRSVRVGNVVLNRYWDDESGPRAESYREDIELVNKLGGNTDIFRHIRAACESGWDFSSRWFEDGESIKTIHTTEILPIDLNCLLYYYEQTLMKLFEIINNHDKSYFYKQKSNQRKEAINDIFWDKEKMFYFDYDFKKSELKQIYSLAALYPLYMGIASLEQAESVANNVKSLFLKAGGLVTTLNKTSQQWDSPNGWAPLQYLAVVGLRRYGYNDLANEITKKWLALNEDVYQKTGKMLEKYNVVDIDLEAGGGEYPLQDGFGWTNGVYLSFLEFLCSLTFILFVDTKLI